MAHPLHNVIGEILREVCTQVADADCRMLVDPACGGAQRIPLFCGVEKSRRTQYCCVDAAVLKRGKVRLVVEIEESNIKPTQVFGKLLATATASHLIHKTCGQAPVEMDDSIWFVQILDPSKLKTDRSAKFEQATNIERSIQSLLPLRNSRLHNYRLFFGGNSEFTSGKLRDDLKAYLTSAITA